MLSAFARFYEVSKEFIPLPSRHYFDQPSDEKPLSGKRIGVKDIFDLRGVPTSASSRDYSAFYGAADSTAPVVQRLIDAGAVIVGKTKTAQFASGEYAHDWVDFLCPFNPRGDGYMEPDCSSSGSAVAAAGYDWLDFALGTDSECCCVRPRRRAYIYILMDFTRSSGKYRRSRGVARHLWHSTHARHDRYDRHPSRVFVCQKMTMMRLSFTRLLTTMSSLLDTIGPFARSITELRLFAPVWYEDHHMSSDVVVSPPPLDL